MIRSARRDGSEARENEESEKRVFILEELIRREIRDGGEGEERGLRKGERKRIEIERKETKGN